MKAMTDQEILKKHDPGIRGRAYIELQIVNKLIGEAWTNSYHLILQDSDIKDYGNDLKTALFDLDEATLVVRCKLGQRKGGWIRLVFGNDGYDLISDYSTSLEEFLKPVNDLADFWGS